MVKIIKGLVYDIKGKISYGVEFSIDLPQGMSYIIDDKIIKSIVCDIEKYNKSIYDSRKDMKKILKQIKSNHKDYYMNEYKENERRIEEEEDPLGLRYVF